MIPFNLHRRIPLVRRPFYQRDVAMAERDLVLEERAILEAESKVAMAERDLVLEERAILEAESKTEHYLSFLRHRPIECCVGSLGISGQCAPDDAELVSRVVASYRASYTTEIGAMDSFWLTDFAQLKKQDHDVLWSGNHDAATTLLRNPISNHLFFGFDELFDHVTLTNHPLGFIVSSSLYLYDNLLRIAEAVGARRLYYPEILGPGAISPTVEDLLLCLDRIFGFSITFPNPYPGEVGLATSRGVASYRAIQALYQAHRINKLVGRDGRVVEIGAGLGRTAFYAKQFGIRDYTIIDLPITNVAQGYFLGRTLGDGAVNLFGEGRSGVRVLPPSAFMEATDQYDLAVNVDSLTEMAIATARDYSREIKARCGVFLSINHKHNKFTVSDVCAELGMKALSRSPYWMRAGYVDEAF
jgi:hypothetical protein